ncbi:MAG: ABC transporter permease [Nocardioidaceae bacterium]
MESYSEEVLLAIQQHALLSLYCVLIASALGVLIGVASYRRAWSSNLTISTSAVAFTIPSIAALGMTLSLFGETLTAVMPVIVMYGLLPIVRNTVVGLQSVDASMLDAARGMGVARFRMLWQIELPSAWPVILAGIRVSAQLTVGVVVIAAFVLSGFGLGGFAFDALNNLGSANTANAAWAATVFTVAIALIFDLVFVIIRRYTIPRGIRV